MRWSKLGRIFHADGQFSWMVSHAGLPVAEHIDGDIHRIYFSTRDANNRSYVGWLETDITRPHNILRLSETPILAPGEPGRFDDAGTSLSCLVRYKGKRYFYFIGWSLRHSVPYHLSIGLAFADGGTDVPTLSGLSGPIVERNPVDPLFCTAPFVLREGDRWRMWYASGVGWHKTGSSLVPAYQTRYAESVDGVNWNRNGTVAVAIEGEELGFSRPSVVHRGGEYLMWHSIREKVRGYRPALARSADGVSWTRHDEQSGIDLSPEGWDSETISYPHVFGHKDRLYMLYCGNEYGRAGLGIAVLD